VIRSKLIAPLAGAIVALCCVGAGGVAVASSAAAPQTPPVGATSSSSQSPATAILSSHVVRSNLLVGHDIAVTGTINPTLGPQTVLLQMRHRHRWIDVGRSLSLANGDFGVRFWPAQIGTFSIRVKLSGVSSASSVTGVTGLTGVSGATAFATDATHVNVYHVVLASWYAPGGTTACGQQLTATMLGVANKTLPCGTMVTFRYRHRYLRVPVIDRGPYVAGRDYDLTYATKRALGAGDLTLLWANH
jgi:hypothetical protein